MMMLMMSLPPPFMLLQQMTQALPQERIFLRIITPLESRAELP
jgi:hypothetical protein